MIDKTELNALLLDGLLGKITWLDASNRYPLDDFIESFYATRERTERSLIDLTDAQAAFTSPAHSTWSISETITHLIYSQGFYHNKLLGISTSQLPHVVEAAKGFGEGAKPNVPAAELRARLNDATAQIRLAIEDTRQRHDPDQTEYSPFFDRCSYKTWVLLLLGHEVDHVRQMIVMRRLARVEADE